MSFLDSFNLQGGMPAAGPLNILPSPQAQTPVGGIGSAASPATPGASPNVNWGSLAQNILKLAQPQQQQVPQMPQISYYRPPGQQMPPGLLGMLGMVK